MSEFIFAIVGLIVGGTVGVLVGSMCHVSKMADEDACTPEVLLEGLRHFNQLQNRLIIWKCPHCKGVITLKMYLEAGRCLYCGAISGGDIG